MQLDGAAVAPDKNELYDTRRRRELVMAVFDPAAFHRHHFDVTAYPLGLNDFEVFKLNIFADDIAANAFANCPVWRLRSQLVERALV